MFTAFLGTIALIALLVLAYLAGYQQRTRGGGRWPF